MQHSSMPVCVCVCGPTDAFFTITRYSIPIARAESNGKLRRRRLTESHGEYQSTDGDEWSATQRRKPPRVVQAARSLSYDEWRRPASDNVTARAARVR
jgi:hypothetical protein